MAEIQIDGDRLVLKDWIVYAEEGDIPNQIGPIVFRREMRNIAQQAKRQGFKELQIIAQRAMHSSASNSGYKIDKIVHLK